MNSMAHQARHTLSRGARGGVVALAGQAGQLVINFLGTILLARLLTPDDFGIFAMLAFFMGIGELIRDFGMPTAALQAKSLTEQQASNVFWVTAALSFTVALLLVIASPLIATLYGQPQLGAIAPVMAGVLLISGLQAQYKVRLARDMKFKTVTAISLTARLAGLGAGVAIALSGWGYWALVFQAVVVAGTTLTLSMIMTRWRPMCPRRGRGSLSLFRVGIANGGANFLSYAADNADNLMLGAIWGPGALGQYNRAYQLFMAAVMSFFNPLTSVIVPTANRAITEGRRAGEILARAQSALCGSAIWLLLVTSVTAPYLIPLLLGDQWNETIRLLQIVSVGGAFKALSQTNYWAYLIEQQSKQLLLSNMVTKPLQIGLVVVAAFYSVEAVAWAFALGRAITWPINVIWLWRTAGLSPVQFGGNGLRLVAAGVAGFLLTSYIYHLAHFESRLLAVCLGAMSSSVVFLTVVFLLPGGRKEAVNALALMRAIILKGHD